MNDTSIRTGTSAILNSLNNIQRNSPFQTENGFDARVSYVLLDDSNKEKFDKYGGFDSIGLIECFRIIDGDLDIEPIIAFPINSNIRRFPVENEVVKIISSTNNSSQNKLNSKKLSFYYGDIIGTWGSTEHNSVPNEVIINKNGPNDKLSEYNEVGAGILKKDTKIEEMSITGDSFKETGNVRKLKHLPGDITYEGRFGNSIRFGGSNNKFKSPWKGFDNSPIIIISNNHGSVVKNNIEPIYEDINKDGSSIFLLSGQEINFIPASINFESYNKKIDIKNNIIKPSILRVDDNKSSSVGDEENINRIVEDTSTIYKNEITGSSKPIFEDDVIFLPDREDPQEGEIIFSEEYVLIVDPEYQENINKFRSNVPNDIPVDYSKIPTVSASESLKIYIIPKLNEIPNIPKGIRYLIEAQILFEGFYPSSSKRRASNSFRNNNPGNFVWDEKYKKYGAKKSLDRVGEGYGVTFPDLKSGLVAKRDYISFILSGKSKVYSLGGNSPLWNGKNKFGYIDTYAPKEDVVGKNKPLVYATFIISYFKGKGITINYSTTLNQLNNIK